MDEYRKESYDELFMSRFVFVRALGTIIPEGSGIFLNFEDDDFEFKKIIVHNTKDIIGVLDASERTDLKHGDWVSIIDNDVISN